MALAVVAPVIVVVICCGDLIMDILYSSGFSPAKPFVAIGIIAMALRAPAWCMAYTMIAKGDGRTYMLTECASAIAYLVFNTILFGAFGFRGLGVAYFLWHAPCTGDTHADGRDNGNSPCNPTPRPLYRRLALSRLNAPAIAIIANHKIQKQEKQLNIS